jgi:hypothetical protein
MTKIQGIAWVPEYSGQDSTWKTYRTVPVTYKKRRHYDLLHLGYRDND